MCIKIQGCLVFPHYCSEVLLPPSLFLEHSQNFFLRAKSSSFSPCNKCEIRDVQDVSDVPSLCSSKVRHNFADIRDECSNRASILKAISSNSRLISFYSHLYVVPCSSSLSSRRPIVSRDDPLHIHVSTHVRCTSIAFPDLRCQFRTSLLKIICLQELKENTNKIGIAGRL
jgi:hypothetical protein